MKKTVLLCYIGLFLLSAYGAFANLNHVSFWDDEAFVGMVSKRHLETGQLSGWTGRNLYGYANGNVLNADLRPINPPLDLWVTSYSFRLFGVSYWSARFPFVIAGLLALALFGLVVRREWPGYTAAQLYAFGSLALSVSFLLNIRTARYYALAMLFGLVCYYAYQSTLTTKRKRDFLLLALGATGLFYTHFLICVVFLCSLTMMHLVYRRKEWASREWRYCIGAIVLFLGLTLPYAIYFRIWDCPFFAPSTVPWFLRYLYLLQIHLMGWLLGGFLPLAVFIALVLLILFEPVRARFQDLRVPLLSWLLLFIIYTLLQVLLSPMPVHGSKGLADLRYYAPMIPFCAGLAGLCLGALHRYSRGLALLGFVFLISCNGLPAAGFRWTLPSFIHEIHSPYPTSGSETTKFLQLYANQDDVVRIIPQNHNYPVMFDLDHKLRFGALLDKDSPVAPENAQKLGKFLWAEQTFPNWLIFYGKSKKLNVWLGYFSRPHLQNGKWVSYSYRLDKELDIFFQQTQRPELPWHSFGPVTGFDKSEHAVYIYRRSAAQAASPPAAGQVWKVPPVRD
jgi:4-amino-4-deoxy-L-arabinose transferase-like glycosyltransferase